MSRIRVGTPAAAGSGSGSLIGKTTYNPGTLASYTATASEAAVDGTNLKVSFKTPASGLVVVRLAAYTTCGAGRQLYFALLNGASQVGAEAQVFSNGATGQSSVWIAVDIPLALTPNTAYTLSWAYRVSAAPGGGMYAGTGAGPAQMRVYDDT